MKSTLFIGVNISKDTLDVSSVSPSDASLIFNCRTTNDMRGFTKLLKWIKQNGEGVPVNDWKVCMDNTEIYILAVNCFLQEKGSWQSLKYAARNRS